MKNEDIDNILYEYFDRSVRQQPGLTHPRFDSVPSASREPVILFGLKFAAALGLTILFLSLPADMMQRSALGEKVDMLIASQELTGEFNNLLRKAEEYLPLHEFRKGGR